MVVRGSTDEFIITAPRGEGGYRTNVPVQLQAAIRPINKSTQQFLLRCKCHASNCLGVESMIPYETIVACIHHHVTDHIRAHLHRLSPANECPDHVFKSRFVEDDSTSLTFLTMLLIVGRQ